MNHLDKIISALYLAKSENREKMLADLVLNVMYSIHEPILLTDIISFIKVTFHLNPIEYEVQECLNTLLENKEINFKDNKYCLHDASKANIYKSIVKEKTELTKRLDTFKVIVKDIFDGTIDEAEISELWTVFNEYLMECFMVFGRKAIDIFLPYKSDELADDDDILKSAYAKLSNEKLVQILKKIVIEYPDRLNEPELRYLTSLASRAEKFYSLGIEKTDYEKIKNLQIKDLVVLVDTNILYSILNLRIHPENAAIFELLRISKEKQVDLRIVYLPKTYTELQKVKAYLEKIIPKENFKTVQIKALLHSEKLDSFAKKYYENKLKNSDLPHPSEKIQYASDFLKSQAIVIYNNRFPELEEDDKFLNSKIAEYLDFQRYYNNLCDEKGYDFHLSKDDKKIEHDVFLREGVRILKSKFSEENELRYICLTLDRSLIHFDHYSLRDEYKGTHKVINPNFILPSLFIKKIRPFIPISTNNYRKAFITSLTAPNLEKEDDKETILVQKSMTYFKNLGIEDEEIILNCIKRELFLENFAKHEKDRTSEEFIETEISKEIDNLKKEKEDLQKAIEEKEKNSAILIEKKETENILIKKEKEQKVQQLESKVLDKEEMISSLESRINLIEQENEKEKKLRIEERNTLLFERKLSEWKNEKEIFISDEWGREVPKLRWKTVYFFFVLIITVCPVIIGFVLKANEKIIAKIEDFGINQWFVWGALTLIFLIELFGRSYIFNKEKVKMGWEWFISIFSKNKRNSIIQSQKDKIETKFIEFKGEQPKPSDKTI